jgi:hypothetical protein
MVSIAGKYLDIAELPSAGGPPVPERRSGKPHPTYDVDPLDDGQPGPGLLMATATALVFWAVIALMLLFILV